MTPLVPALLGTLLATGVTPARPTAVALPSQPPVGMDYLAYDAKTDRIWVPAGNTGNIYVVDPVTNDVATIAGLPTAPARRPDRPRMGPSSATVADGVVWVGDRADRSLRAYDAKKLYASSSGQLAAMPDGIQYVSRTHELWVTTPSERAIAIVRTPRGGNGSNTLRSSASIALPGSPEGYAVDEARGVFYTNLEDKDQTLAIDVATRKVTATWPATCGAEGPRGLAIDEAQHWLFVACTNGARVLDLAHDGKVLGRVDTGAGVDNLAYDVARRRLFVASARTGDMIITDVADDGALKLRATVATAPGARNPIVDARGTAYVEDAAGGRLIVVAVPAIKSR